MITSRVCWKLVSPIDCSPVLRGAHANLRCVRRRRVGVERLTPLSVRDHVQVAMAGGPLLMLLHQDRTQEPDGRVAVGEDADDPLTPPNLFIEPLQAVGCA